VNWCFTPLFNHVWLNMALSFHSWRKKNFLGVNQQPSVSNWQLPLMGFEPQQRRVVSKRDALTTRPRRPLKKSVKGPQRNCANNHLHRHQQMVWPIPICSHKSVHTSFFLSYKALLFLSVSTLFLLFNWVSCFLVKKYLDSAPSNINNKNILQ